ncbi:hypothetical protein [Kaarinaea lacus]
MKFGELKIGSMFTLDGETYVKTSPMIGLNKTSQTQKFIRRSVEVVLCGREVDATTLPKTDSLSHSEVAKAFADFYANCEQCLQTLGLELDEKAVASMRTHLAQAKQQFMDKIKRR